MLQAQDYQEAAVLCFVLSPEGILLIEKLRGLGAGKINGPGGKVEAGESYTEAAIRETEEEVNIVPSALEKVARIGFRFADGYSLFVEAFISRTFTGTPSPSAEAIPFWCPLNDIPYHRMWADDVFWLPAILQGNKIEGVFDFDGDTMLSAQISLMPS